jgi:hypothetical protein
MCVFNFEIPVWQPIFLSKTNSMLTENALHSKHSSIDGFLSTDTCVSSTQLNRLVRNIEHLSPLVNGDWQAVFLSKINSVLTGKQCAT